MCVKRDLPVSKETWRRAIGVAVMRRGKRVRSSSTAGFFVDTCRKRPTIVKRDLLMRRGKRVRNSSPAGFFVDTFVCVYACVCVCMCVYACMCVYIYVCECV